MEISRESLDATCSSSFGEPPCVKHAWTFPGKLAALQHCPVSIIGCGADLIKSLYVAQVGLSGEQLERSEIMWARSMRKSHVEYS